jgi:NitT/TauT family transport system permease protein
VDDAPAESGRAIAYARKMTDATGGGVAATGAASSARGRWRVIFSRGSTWVHVGQVIIVVVALLAWQRVGSQPGQNLTVSTPSATWSWAVQWIRGEQAHGLSDLWATVEEAAIGWVLGVLIGAVLAVAMAASEWLRLFAAPFLAALNALPKIAVAPLFILVFGANEKSKVYFVAAAIFFIVFYNVLAGLRSINQTYLDQIRGLGASRLGLVRDVYLPSIAGWIITGLRLTATWALTAAVLAEYLGSVQGIGYIVQLGQQSLATSQVMAGILVISIVALVVDGALVLVERRFAHWRTA